jgi:hypothetical protein
MADAPGATVTGKSGTDYVLEFGTNMFCRLEEATGKAYVELLQELRGPFPSVRTVRAFVQAAWVNRNATADEAGLLIDDLGGWEVVVGILSPDSEYGAVVKQLQELREEIAARSKEAVLA